MLGCGRDGIKRRPEVGGGRLQILGEIDLFFSLESSRSPDFLEVGLERSALASRVQFFGRNDRCSSHGGLCGGGCLGLLVLTRHGFVLSLSVSRSGSEMFGYRPKRFGFSTLWIVDVAHGATRSTAPGSVLVLVLLCLAVLFVSLELLSSFFRVSSELLFFVCVFVCSVCVESRSGCRSFNSEKSLMSLLIEERTKSPL